MNINDESKGFDVLLKLLTFTFRQGGSCAADTFNRLATRRTTGQGHSAEKGLDRYRSSR
jgi:hypothetical protein